jgi:hypothetical protein
MSHETATRVLTAAKCFIYSLQVTPGCFGVRRAHRDEHVLSIALGGEKEPSMNAHFL